MIINPTQAQGDDERRDAEALSQATPRPPTEVPGYEIEARLGEGAFGEVWLALDHNTGVRVAIKFYTHHGRRETTALAAEVQKLAFLFGDRHVIQLIDVGWEAEPPYFVMEYLPQGSLEARLHDGPLPVDQAVATIRDVAVALVHAHGKGIFHCDLKPANVLLDADGLPRLADFGQSRLSHERAPALGTLFYMAPEQADTAAAPDARWDVYALGVLLYQMLTGRPPHSDLPEATALREVAALEERLAAYRRLVRTAPRPAAHRKVADRALAEIVDRCLAPEPSRRYPNPQAVLEALDARTLWRARRPLVALAAMAPALLMVLVLAYFGQRGFDATVAESTRSLIAVNRVSTQTVARLTADRVAEAAAQRWNALRRVAADPEFQALLAAAAGQGRDAPEVARLQAALWTFHGAYKELPAHSWNVFDADGVQLAATTFDPTNTTFLNVIGRNFSYRDYFHGLGADVAPGTETEPLRDVHRSISFRGTSSHARLVCLTVPVWRGAPTGPDHPRLGVLVMMVKVGAFADFLPQHALEDDLVASLVDVQPDWQGRDNVILGHPFLARWLADGKPPARIPEHALPRHPAEWSEDYRDPFGREDPGAFGRPWFAAGAPVRVAIADPLGRPAGARDLGWWVVVQQDRNTVIRPVRDLQQFGLRWRRYVLGWIALILAALCGFFVFALSNASRARFTAFLRRRAGLSTPGASASLGRRSHGSAPAERTQAAAGKETVRANVLATARSLAPEPPAGPADEGSTAVPTTLVPHAAAPSPAAAAASDWAWRAEPLPLETEIGWEPPPEGPAAPAADPQAEDRAAGPARTETGGEPWPT